LDVGNTSPVDEKIMCITLRRIIFRELCIILNNAQIACTLGVHNIPHCEIHFKTFKRNRANTPLAHLHTVFHAKGQTIFIICIFTE
jgi:hypothetical protein